MTTINGLSIEAAGPRDWTVRNDDGEYLGTITEMEAVEGAPFYVTSIECFDSPAHKTLASAYALFTCLREG